MLKAQKSQIVRDRLGRLGRLGRLVMLSGVIVGAACGAVADTVVNISGDYAGTVIGSNGNYITLDIDSTELFNPLHSPVSVTGQVSLGDLPNDSTIFVGLIAKDRYDAWMTALPGAYYLGFLETAYAGFTDGNGGRIRLGQQQGGGETLQTNVVSGVGTSFSDFNLTFDDTSMSFTYGANPTKTQTYADYKPYLASGGTVATDWSNGAYAFVGTWFTGTGNEFEINNLSNMPSIDLTFTQAVVPIPGAASLALLGLGLTGLVSRRKPVPRHA